MAYQDYYTSVDDYNDIWELSGFRHSYEGVSEFFPENLEELDVKEFNCRYDQQVPLGEGVQIFLQIHYSDEEKFLTEVQRVKSISIDAKEYFGDIGCEVYATKLGEEYSLKYAVLDEEAQMIYYIYVYSLPKDEIEFDHEFLPDRYVDYVGIEIETTE